MPMTPRETAEAIQRWLRGRGRGTVFKDSERVWEWLELTPWFKEQFPNEHDQLVFVDKVLTELRSIRGQKAVGTRKANKRKKEKRAKAEARKRKDARQGELDL